MFTFLSLGILSSILARDNKRKISRLGSIEERGVELGSEVWYFYFPSALTERHPTSHNTTQVFSHIYDLVLLPPS